MVQKLHVQSFPWKGNLVRVDVRGSLTADSVAQLDDEFSKHFDEGHDSFVIHLGQLTALSLVGGAALIGKLRIAQERGGSITLVQPSPEVEKVLGTLGVLHLLHIAHDTAELIGAGSMRRAPQEEAEAPNDDSAESEAVESRGEAEDSSHGDGSSPPEESQPSEEPVTP